MSENEVHVMPAGSLESWISGLATELQVMSEYSERQSKKQTYAGAIQCRFEGRAEAFGLVADIMRERVHPTVKPGMPGNPRAFISTFRVLMQMLARVSDETREGMLIQFEEEANGKQET